MATGRNDPCPCGSGAKFKRCCGRVELAAPTESSTTTLASSPAIPVPRIPEPLTPALTARITARIAAREYAELESESRELTARYPRSGIAWKALGLALMMQDRDALGALQQAAALRPADPEVHANLGNALQNAERLADAIASYRRAIALAPGFADLHLHLGTLYRQQGQPQAAEESCRLALKLKPQSAAATALLAALHADRGQFAEAELLCRQALVIDPDSSQALADIAHLRRMTAQDKGWLEEAQRHLALPLQTREEAYLRFAIGKYQDDLQDYPHAFANYQRANELTRQSRPIYDGNAQTHAVDLMISRCDRAWLEGMRNGAHASARPVFIIGMPRSGTTLAEQILASHPAVYGAGELDFWTTQPAISHFLLNPASVDRTILDRLAADYLQLLQRLESGAARVVDKMPTNFLYLGLIHAALPGARFIHMRRNPIDTCLSIYFQNLGPLHAYATDLQDLAQYYREYQRLLAHWRSLLAPTALLEVSYEALVADPETWIRRLVEFVDLPWDTRCLDFDHAERAVITASKWQVRQKINQSSVGRWRNYQGYIAPLLTLAAAGPG